jgi:TonB family protein
MRCVVAFLFVAATSVLPQQGSQELHNRSGETELERFAVRPGISLTVQYGSDHLACQFVIEPSNPLVPSDTIGSYSPMSSYIVTEILEEIVPMQTRGKQVSISSTAFGFADETVVSDYENVSITRIRPWRPEHQDYRATAVLKRDICPKPTNYFIGTQIKIKATNNLVRVETLTPLEGVDFSDYLTRLIPAVTRNWYAVMPESALMGHRGKVVVRIQVQKDGTLLSRTPTVEVSSDEEALDKAAVEAIRSSAPFEQLPEAFRSLNIELHFTFVCNLLALPRPHPKPHLVPVPDRRKELGPVNMK